MDLTFTYSSELTAYNSETNKVRVIGNLDIGDYVIHNDALYFSGDNGDGHGIELRSYNSKTNEIKLLVDINENRVDRDS